MASTVLSGSSNPTYTNNTGQNVRVVINFMRSLRTTFSRGIFTLGRETLTINWAGVSQTYRTEDDTPDSRGNVKTVARTVFIGRNLAFVQSIVASESDLNTTNPGKNGPVIAALSSSNAMAPSPANDTSFNFAPSEIEVAFAFPTEIILAPNETFSAVCGIHNIIVIPELG
jgi:hypothetical protein